jgi:transposase
MRSSSAFCARSTKRCRRISRSTSSATTTPPTSIPRSRRLAARPRWHLHFIPTYSSWFNLVERFFALISDKTIRRGSFRSVRDLVAKIDHFVTRYNQTCQPFVWTATADSILAKLQRLCSRINGTEH